MAGIAKVTADRGDGAVSSEYGPGPLKAPFLAALPHVLMGLLIGIGKLLSTCESMPSPRTSSVVGVLLVCLVAGVLYYAWRRGWPLWSANWYGYGTWIVLAAIVFAFQRLDLGNDSPYANVLFLVWFGVCVNGYLLILVKDRLKALMAIAFLFPLLGVQFLEFVPNPIEGWVAIGVGLLIALITGITTHVGDFSTGLKLLLGGNLVVGLALAYVGEYQASDLPSSVPFSPSFSKFAVLLGLNWAVALGLIGGSVLILRLWNSPSWRFRPIEQSNKRDL